MEKLRADKLSRSGIMIQKTIKAWMQWRKYQRLRKATILLQARARGLLARRLLIQHSNFCCAVLLVSCLFHRHTQFLRETRAAIRIQKRIRGFLCKTKYLRLCCTALAIQCHYRGQTARKAYMRLLYENKAVVIQRYARGWLARMEFRRSIHHIVITQAAIRRWLARRELKKLKVCTYS